MIRWIELSTWLWLALMLLVIIRALAIRSPRRETKPCPGPQPSLARSLLTCWIPRLRFRPDAACGYDLSATTPSHDGLIRCPECGAIRNATTRTIRAWRCRSLGRAAPLIVILLTLAASAHLIRPILLCRWCRHTPSTILVSLADHAPGRAGLTARRVLADRLIADRLGEWNRDRLARAAIRALRDDRRAGNGMWAMEILSNLGDRALPRVIAALDSKDYQQRQFAASILRERWETGQGVHYWRPRQPAWEAPDRLFEVCVEGLGSDSLTGGHQSWVANAYDGLFFLAVNPDRAPRFLIPALSSTDEQQRFLSAVTIGLCGSTEHTDRAAPILISNLISDQQGGNATIATRALYLLGPSVLPYLRPLVLSPDDQQARLATLILLDLGWPNAPRAIRYALNNQATGAVLDPATDLTLSDIREQLRGMW